MPQFIENMERRNIDELIILDVNATLENRKPLYEYIKFFTSNLHCPITYGGGISSLDDVKILVQECGIDKIAVKSRPWIIHDVAKKFGSQSVIYAADFKNNETIDDIPKKLKWNKWLTCIQNEGAGEILLTDIPSNGTQKGYNYSLINRVSKLVSIPVIANGGCGDPLHMVKAIQKGANAVAVSSMFLFSDITPNMCAKILSENNIPVRLDGRARRPVEALGRPVSEDAP